MTRTTGAEPSFVVFEVFKDDKGKEIKSNFRHTVFIGSLVACKAEIEALKKQRPDRTYEYEAEDI